MLNETKVQRIKYVQQIGLNSLTAEIVHPDRPKLNSTNAETEQSKCDPKSKFKKNLPDRSNLSDLSNYELIYKSHHQIVPP